MGEDAVAQVTVAMAIAVEGKEEGHRGRGVRRADLPEEGGRQGRGVRRGALREEGGLRASLSPRHEAWDCRQRRAPLLVALVSPWVRARVEESDPTRRPQAPRHRRASDDGERDATVAL